MVLSVGNLLPERKECERKACMLFLFSGSYEEGVHVETRDVCARGCGEQNGFSQRGVDE